MILPARLIAECQAAHASGKLWRDCLQSIQADLEKLANGNKATLTDLREQSLHVWASNELSGRIPPAAVLEPEPTIRRSDCTTAANIRHCRELQYEN